jgi:hypothetical protein
MTRSRLLARVVESPGRLLWLPFGGSVCKRCLEMEDHAMSHVRNGYVVSARREFLGGFVSGLLALALFDTAAAAAQEVKQVVVELRHFLGGGHVRWPVR